jgi:putative acetyltransferase
LTLSTDRNINADASRPVVPIAIYGVPSLLCHRRQGVVRRRPGPVDAVTDRAIVDVQVTQEPWDAPDGARLRAAQRAELDARYGSDDHEPGMPPSAEDVPIFVIARGRDGNAVGCGGLRPLEPGVAEIKRMYVAPEQRGTGVATAILRELEACARHAGMHRLVLETGTLQPEAIRFYQREGYEQIDNFGPYRGAAQSVCFARTLDSANCS